MKLDGRLIGLVFAGLLFLSIGIANAAGLWVTESNKEPTLIKEGEFAGMADPGDIRGSYSFGDIETAFDMPAALIAEAFAIETAMPEAVLCKDLEAIYPLEDEDLEIGTGSVKQFVALYTGLPYQGDDGIPSTAVKVLRREGVWTDAMSETFKDRIVEIEGLIGGQGAGQPSGLSEGADDHETSIGVKGNTTAAEVIEWGIDKDQLEQVLGLPIEQVNMTIRDICTQNDLSFSNIKLVLNNLLEDGGDTE